MHHDSLFSRAGRTLWAIKAALLAVSLLVAGCPPPGKPGEPEPPAGEPYGACRVSVDCRVGICSDGLCLPPRVRPLALGLDHCNGDKLRYGRVSPEPFVDCTAWGARCLPRRGCALPPRARCSIDGKDLLHCGAGDVCVDEHCVADDVGGYADATLLAVPGSVTFTVDGPDDVDVIAVDRASPEQFSFVSNGILFGVGGRDPLTGEPAGMFLSCSEPGTYTVSTDVRDTVEGCIDDVTVRDLSGGVTRCPANTVCRRLMSLQFGCVPALGQPCISASRCGGYCRHDLDECTPLPQPLPPINHCTVVDGVTHYRVNSLRGYVCNDRCLDGIGCINTAPTSTCKMWLVDPAGGFAPCDGTPDVPAWLEDDFPGHYAPAPLVSVGTHELESTRPGDIDCLTLVVPVRGVVTATSSSGRVLFGDEGTVPPTEPVEAGEHVRVCVEDHQGRISLEVGIIETAD